jgi:serine/threonine-protein kinase
MYVVAASYLASVALFFCQVYAGPPMVSGFQGHFTGGGMVVLSVHPNSPEAEAGLKEGDRVLSVNGQGIRNVHDWEAVRANTEIGRPERWQIARGTERFDLTVAVPRLAWRERLSGSAALGRPFYWLNLLGYCAFNLASLVLGLVIAFRRPYDPLARMGAWLLATAAVAFGFPDGWAATWRHLPGWLGLLLWIPEISRFVPDAILLTFFTIFPRKIFSARWPWLLIWTPALALLPWRVLGMYRVIYQPGHATEVPAWVLSAISLRSAVYVMGSLVILILSYRRLEDANQRRRVRVVLAGVVASTLGVIGWVVVGSARAVAFWLLALQPLLYLLWLAFPLSFAYAILRHRLFDVGVLIRQGVQYAVARGALLSLVPMLGVVLLADAFLHGSQPLISILAMRGWVYVTAGALALVAHTRRERWLGALDRRFFRERYDAQQLLREVVEDIRQAGSLERVAPRVVARIEAALHPEFVALLVHERGEASYRSLAAAPAGQAPPPLSATSKVAALLRALESPLEMSHSESGWLQQQLPPKDVDFLRQARFDLLVPISTASDRTEALLALGVKRSEEPYAQDDRNLLITIASNLAMLLERPAAAPVLLPTSGAFVECPQCGACYDPGAGPCPQEGATPVPMRLPRVLAGRYRVERRRGRGGMGTVYEATDTALERRVAVKVIHDSLVGSAEAAERFRSEARVAASFAHPNVVTVYDFGSVAETRAFLVMELLEGVTLREELHAQPRSAPGRVVEIMRGVCAAVQAAHRRHLVHRDLKPENIFLSRGEAGEVPKVLDFGVAKFLPAADLATANTQSGMVVGTLAYMAPEQLRGQPVDPAWDLWALAVVTYEMLTGVHPFVRPAGADYNAVLMGRFTPLATYLRESPTRWQQFLERALHVDPARRPNSAQTFFSELERALA